ncbi:hypothetical protein [Azovibrio restrictus]|uniref:hypothetical protein n=1 Tax=Azovibrio restrictus TaxID=146938 RepID=UPI0026F0949D|nr:hypothetical protein [Azovibrio restrictus]MDD3481708.1 hypothetical protein [Azovibrio restrictus]
MEPKHLALADSIVVDALDISDEQKLALNTAIYSLYQIKEICARLGLGINEITTTLLVSEVTGITIPDQKFLESREQLQARFDSHFSRLQNKR